MIQPTFGEDWPAPPEIPTHLQDVEQRPKWSRAHIVSRRLQRGEHPLGRFRLAEHADVGYGQTCGACVNLRVDSDHSRRYYKCRLGPISGGPATDIRLRWPACVKWGPRDPATTEVNP